MADRTDTAAGTGELAYASFIVANRSKPRKANRTRARAGLAAALPDRTWSARSEAKWRREKRSKVGAASGWAIEKEGGGAAPQTPAEAEGPHDTAIGRGRMCPIPIWNGLEARITNNLVGLSI